MNILFRQDQALYLQIAEHFRRQIAMGKLRPGERLPPIRELAQSLGLDPGTVARAYRELHREGVITGYRGGGSQVSPAATDQYIIEQQKKHLDSIMDRAILEAFGLGFTTEEIETAFTFNLAQWRERRLQTASSKQGNRARLANEVRFFGSHDMAIELLANHLATIHPGINFTASYVGSLAGIMALECRDSDLTGAHLFDNETGEFNTPFIKRLMPNEAVVLIGLVQRVQGLMVAPGNPKNISGLLDLKRQDIKFVNRQRGSGTRMLLDSQLQKIGLDPASVSGYEREEKTHIGVATLVAQGDADVGLGAQSAAVITRLGFIPLFKERYDLVTLQENLANPALQKVIALVRQDSYQKILSSMPGYELTGIGVIRPVNAD